MAIIDKRAVAARLRSLMTAPVDQVARWLHVSDAAVRAAVQSLGPRPTIEVIVAASIYYGVDPAWILAEAYDPDALRAAAEGDLDATTAAVVRMLRASELESAYDETESLIARRPTDQTVTEFSRPARDRTSADRRDPTTPPHAGGKESPRPPRTPRSREGP